MKPFPYLYQPFKKFMARFSEEDQNRIRAAVKQAEEKISGEIVPVFVEQSGFYTIAQYRGALIAAALTFIGVIVYDKLVPTWGVFEPFYIFSIVVLGSVLGAVLPQFIVPLKRLLVGQKHLDRSTRNKAENAFLEQEVFNTRHRTGIMIFISFFEREVIVMADRGINKVVEQKEWDNVVRMILKGIAKGNLVEGMEHAIARCGAILLEKGFDITPDDVNELRDDLRVD
jgi:putative membrane protein